MSFDAVASIIINMQELRGRENLKKEDMNKALIDLAVVQKKIASIEQDLSHIQKEYLRLDDEVRPNMAAYLKTNLPKQDEEYLF